MCNGGLDKVIRMKERDKKWSLKQWHWQSDQLLSAIKGGDRNCSARRFTGDGKDNDEDKGETGIWIDLNRECW